MKQEAGLSTMCVHGGELKDAHGALHTPLYDTTTFAFGSTADLLDVVEGRKAGSLYTRYGLKPTIQSLEAKRKRHLKALEGLFVQVLTLCQAAGLVRLGHVALDGTRVKACASKHGYA